ncbi:hypothetical protein LD39_05505 [Halobacillus sp. BBL2006]|nr:hypothetical protein LD39_05505 [Halobacillus sp. BBL2006]
MWLKNQWSRSNSASRSTKYVNTHVANAADVHTPYFVNSNCAVFVSVNLHIKDKSLVSKKPAGKPETGKEVNEL